MAEELRASGRAILDHLNAIAERGPLVVQNLQARLCERIQSLVNDTGVTIEPGDVVRETAILADRCDIIRGNRPPASPYEPVPRNHRRAAKCGKEARVRSARDRPRDQHDRIQGERRAASAAWSSR